MKSRRFKVQARETRGGWRGVILAHNGAVAFKTMPVFRERRDAETAARSWLKEHGAHADARRSRRPAKGAAVWMIDTTHYGHVVGYDPDGSVMVRWSGKPSVVTGVAPGKLKIVPPGYAGSADAQRGGYLDPARGKVRIRCEKCGKRFTSVYGSGGYDVICPRCQASHTHTAHGNARRRRYPEPRRGGYTRRGAYVDPDPIRGRGYYVVDIRSGQAVAGPFSPVGKADRHLAAHYSHKTHQVIDGRYLTVHAFRGR